MDGTGDGNSIALSYKGDLRMAAPPVSAPHRPSQAASRQQPVVQWNRPMLIVVLYVVGSGGGCGGISTYAGCAACTCAGDARRRPVCSPTEMKIQSST